MSYLFNHINHMVGKKQQAHIPPETAFALGSQCEWNWHKHEIHMTNTSPNVRGHNATCIPPACVGASIWHCMVSLLKHYRVALGLAFGPQDILDTNMLVSATRFLVLGAAYPKWSPNMNGLGFWWNICFTIFRFAFYLKEQSIELHKHPFLSVGGCTRMGRGYRGDACSSPGDLQEGQLV